MDEEIMFADDVQEVVEEPKIEEQKEEKEESEEKELTEELDFSEFQMPEELNKSKEE